MRTRDGAAGHKSNTTKTNRQNTMRRRSRRRRRHTHTRRPVRGSGLSGRAVWSRGVLCCSTVRGIITCCSSARAPARREHMFVVFKYLLRIRLQRSTCANAIGSASVTRTRLHFACAPHVREQMGSRSHTLHPVNAHPVRTRARAPTYMA